MLFPKKIMLRCVKGLLGLQVPLLLLLANSADSLDHFIQEVSTTTANRFEFVSLFINSDVEAIRGHPQSNVNVVM